jgi:hypothetical protein
MQINDMNELHMRNEQLKSIKALVNEFLFLETSIIIFNGHDLAVFRDNSLIFIAVTCFGEFSFITSEKKECSQTRHFHCQTSARTTIHTTPYRTRISIITKNKLL